MRMDEKEFAEIRGKRTVLTFGSMVLKVTFFCHFIPKLYPTSPTSDHILEGIQILKKIILRDGVRDGVEDESDCTMFAEEEENEGERGLKRMV